MFWNTLQVPKGSVSKKYRPDSHSGLSRQELARQKALERMEVGHEYICQGRSHLF